MMKIITIYQPQIIEWGLDLIECVVLDYIVKANNWANSIEHEGSTYYEVSSKKIAKDLPILKVTDRSIQRYINQLIKKGFISKALIKSKAYYKIDDKLKKYYFLGGATEMSGGATNLSEGATEMSDNNIYNNIYINKYINNNNINIYIEEIYKNYYNNIPKDKKKYSLSAKTKLYLKALLKEYSKEDLIESANNYFKQISDKKYIMASQYFYSNTTVQNAKHYRPFLEYIKQDKTEIDKDFNLGF